jgi:hypothetical protein
MKPRKDLNLNTIDVKREVAVLLTKEIEHGHHLLCLVEEKP